MSKPFTKLGFEAGQRLLVQGLGLKAAHLLLCAGFDCPATSRDAPSGTDNFTAGSIGTGVEDGQNDAGKV
ncbi:hypothetical protein [Pelagibius sp. Alg239-R121]|uniref:hypothetical protein n=1 Tax=Pelagibius sp. Alg239-R121 TaxID=2993448 RepID=UPI0024A72504|nr:hypothetical protein [Pelagibius sp. Alg239-R121]